MRADRSPDALNATRKQAPTIAQQIARAGPKEHDEQELKTASARPHLVVVNEATGSVTKALTEILKPVPGKRVEIADANKGYATRCREMGVKPLRPWSLPTSSGRPGSRPEWSRTWSIR